MFNKKGFCIFLLFISFNVFSMKNQNEAESSHEAWDYDSGPDCEYDYSPGEADTQGNSGGYSSDFDSEAEETQDSADEYSYEAPDFDSAIVERQEDTDTYECSYEAPDVDSAIVGTQGSADFDIELAKTQDNTDEDSHESFDVDSAAVETQEDTDFDIELARAQGNTDEDSHESFDVDSAAVKKQDNADFDSEIAKTQRGESSDKSEEEEIKKALAAYTHTDSEGTAWFRYSDGRILGINKNENGQHILYFSCNYDYDEENAESSKVGIGNNGKQSAGVTKLGADSNKQNTKPSKAGVGNGSGKYIYKDCDYYKIHGISDLRKGCNKGRGINGKGTLNVGNVGGVNVSVDIPGSIRAAKKGLSAIKNFIFDPIKPTVSREIKQTDCFRALQKYYEGDRTMTLDEIVRTSINNMKAKVFTTSILMFAISPKHIRAGIIKNKEKCLREYKANAELWKGRLEKKPKQHEICIVHYNYIASQAEVEAAQEELEELIRIHNSDEKTRQEIVKNLESNKQSSALCQIQKQIESNLPMGQIYKVVCDGRTGKVIEVSIAKDPYFKDPTIKVKNVETCTINRNDIIIPKKEVFERSLKDAKVIYKKYSHPEKIEKEQNEDVSTQNETEACFVYEEQEENEKERLEASKEDLKNNGKIRVEEFEISGLFIKELLAKGKNPEDFIQFVGNESQYISQKQNIEAANRIIEVSGIIVDNQEELGDLKNIGIDLILTSAEYNKIGSIVKANECTDAAYIIGSILAEAVPLTASVAKGGTKKAFDMATHPGRTLENALLKYVYLANFAAKTLIEGADVIGTTMVAKSELGGFKAIPGMGDFIEKIQDAAQGRLDQKFEFLKNSFLLAQKNIDTYLRNTPRHKIAEDFGAFLVEILIDCKLGARFSRLFGKIAPVAGKATLRMAEKGAKFVKGCSKGEQLIGKLADGTKIFLVNQTINTAKDIAAKIKSGLPSLQSLKLLNPETIVKNYGFLTEGSVDLNRVIEILRPLQHLKSEVYKVAKEFDNGIKLLGGTLFEAVGSRVIIDTKSLMHIFGLEISALTKAKGFHHDYLNNFLKRGIVRIEDMTICPKTGCIEGRLFYNGRSYGRKTFFPPAWTREQVVEKIRESLKNATKKEIETLDDGSTEIISKTNCGIEIRSIITKGRLSTSHPML